MYLTFNRIGRVRPLASPHNGAAAIDELFDGIFHRAPAATAATPSSGSSLAARFDVVEHADRFEARVEMPGVGKDDIDVQIDGTAVRIKAEVKAVEAADGAKVLHSNRVTRSWLRNFTLPSEVDDARAEAAYQDGVLTLTLPKKEVVQPKRLAIK